ncbi:stalk domain-containing protein [Paenibacillus solisilvae]|uniref:Stalk domain-containing protein n=1 Tax=Paenibacillus solisilvae TaxID=2486751 RepID=A0ABW0VUJ0_9BACL
MNRLNKSVSVLLTISMLAAAFFTFAVTAFADDLPSKPTVNQDVAPQLKAFADLKQQFADKKPIADIKAAYIASFEKNVLAIDSSIKAGDPLVNENIRFVLDQAVAGTLSYQQAEQAVDKGLQFYFFFIIKNLLNTGAKTALTAGDQATAQAFVDKAALVYTSALEATVQATDDHFTISQKAVFDQVLPLFKDDIAKKDLVQFNVHRQLIDKTLIKVFALAALSYAQKISALPAAEQPAAVIAGYFTYQSVYGYLRGGDAVDADIVNKAFASGDVKKINAAAIKRAITRCFVAKVSAYSIEVTEKIGKKDLAGAAATGGELVGFFAANEPFLGENYKEAQALNPQILTASAAGDTAAIKLLTNKMAEYLVQLDGITFKPGTKAVTVNGANQTVAAAAFVQKSTFRTLVPTRYLELLGYTVNYVAATKTAVVSKDGITLELAIGANTVVKNGEVIKDFKLDQPVVVKDKATFLPLRAIAELSGNHAYYYNGQVIVIK